MSVKEKFKTVRFDETLFKWIVKTAKKDGRTASSFIRNKMQEIKDGTLTIKN